MSVAYGFAAKAADLVPANPYAWSNLGYLSEQQFRFEDAHKHYAKALGACRTDDQKAMVAMNLSALLCTEGRYSEAEGQALKSLALRPDKKKAIANLGLSRLAQRKWDGWKLYDESLGLNAVLQRSRIDYGVPDWDGSRKRVVLFGEQGLGDEICFASMIPDVRDRTTALTVDCDLRLKGLFQRSFRGVEIHGTRWADHRPWLEGSGIEVAASMLGAGKFVRTTDESFSGKPYLVADPERVLMWKALFKSYGKPVYGIAWSGGLPETGSHLKRLSFEDLKPLLAKDAVFVSLQYKPEAMPGVRQFKELYSKDYDDTAALVAALDCVVAPPTAVVHLAGALGTKCIAMKGPVSCWKFNAGLPFTTENMTLIEHQGSWLKTVEEACKSL
jgi:predicted component of type VI protein secretion system